MTTAAHCAGTSSLRTYAAAGSAAWSLGATTVVVHSSALFIAASGGIYRVPL
ncbi:MAG: hypothetical protein IT378_24685 [Sandaracinaceae bacterium]|nr:hypothetical protein [Sandaracinaceae bacterium]